MKRDRALMESLKGLHPKFADAQWLKLSNQALRAMPSSPRQKALKDKMTARERELEAK
jgi:hypothetical protein